MRRRISVLGLGYVGLPAATSFGRAGFDVEGFDIDTRRMSELANRYDRTHEIHSSAVLAPGLRYYTSTPEEKIVSADTPETQEILGATYPGVVQAGGTRRASLAVLERAVIPAGVTQWRL